MCDKQYARFVQILASARTSYNDCNFLVIIEAWMRDGTVAAAARSSFRTGWETRLRNAGAVPLPLPGSLLFEEFDYEQASSMIGLMLLLTEWLRVRNAKIA